MSIRRVVPVETLCVCVALCSVHAHADPAMTPEDVSVFEGRSLLTSPGRWIVEPSVSLAHATDTLVAIEGLTIIPALVIGLINVSQSQRDVVTGAVAVRTGIADRVECSVKLPWLRVSEHIRERRAFDASPVDIISDSSGQGVGDVEAMVNVQLSDGRADGPHWFSNFRVKAPTGTHPFEIDRRELTNTQGVPIGVVLDEQPTGSGFWSVQPGLSVMVPSDPAVVYAMVNYQFNLSRDHGEAAGGRIDPGDTFGASFGMGFAINAHTSFSLGYDHTVVFESTVQREEALLNARFDRLHAGSLLFGISHAFRESSVLNVALAAGITEQAPDVQLTLRMPTEW